MLSVRSFSSMRHLKSYFRSTMSQSRLNHVMLLSINREKVDKLDIDVIADHFVQGSETDFATLANLHRILKSCMKILLEYSRTVM